MPVPSNSGTDDIIPVPDVVPVVRMKGEDDEDTAFFGEMLEQATNYIHSFSWCDSVIGSYFAGGVGKIFAIFLFNISSRRSDVELWEWIFVGDVPPAYLPLEDARSRMQAFDTYLDGMRRWVAVAREGREPEPKDCCPPVNVPATPEWAEAVDGRLRMLTELVRPYFE
jgi:hypothetical protein